MTFTAFTGAVSHFVIAGGIADYTILLLCIVFTWISALITAKFANKASEITMNRALGYGLVVLSAVMIAVNLFH
jgi:hypothetical protein